LRVLEYGEFIKVGSSKVQKTDVRIVAATNKDLSEAIQKGKFREDLYYRLSTVPIYVPSLRDRGDDIILLFRKFAIDFAEKYRTKPVQLTEDAKTILLEYRFPGNIRQLKNLVEQMSVLSIEREVNAATLLKYLPKEKTLLPALYTDLHKKPEGFTERDLLYKILFDLRKDVTDMKKLVHHMLKQGNYSDEIIQENQELFENIGTEIAKEKLKPAAYLLEGSSKSKPYELSPLRGKSDFNSNGDKEEIEDITHETELDESLSIEKKEKELIIKALHKNQNKRKYAAQDLGISERTLYRKIKQYELEDI
jgi:DNA-binding NtrC family response regulator